jgi:hypothetical protein
VASWERAVSLVVATTTGPVRSRAGVEHSKRFRSKRHPTDHSAIVGGLLEDVIAGVRTYVLPARRLADNGLDAWAQVIGNGYQGYVGKDEASPYVGGRTRLWAQGEGARVDRRGRWVESGEGVTKPG